MCEGKTKELEHGIGIGIYQNEIATLTHYSLPVPLAYNVRRSLFGSTCYLSYSSNGQEEQTKGRRPGYFFIIV